MTISKSRQISAFAGLFLIAVAILPSPSVGAQMRGFEADVMAELNDLREDPRGYSAYIAQTRARFDGNILRGRSRDEIDIMTQEGVSAVHEAVAALRAAKSAPSLLHAPLLARAASDLVAEQGRSGGVGHRSRGRLPADRAVARGGGRYVSEVITYGHSDPASVMEQFVVDDGVPNRGHRKTLLAQEFRYAGAACGAHPVHRSMCVILLSQTIDGKAPPPTTRQP